MTNILRFELFTSFYVDKNCILQWLYAENCKMPSVEETRNFSLGTKDCVTGASWLIPRFLKNFSHHCSNAGRGRTTFYNLYNSWPKKSCSSEAILRHLLVFCVALYISLESISKLPKSKLVLTLKNYSSIPSPPLCPPGQVLASGKKILAKLTITGILFL